VQQKNVTLSIVIITKKVKAQHSTYQKNVSLSITTISRKAKAQHFKKCENTQRKRKKGGTQHNSNHHKSKNPNSA
jgi:hypothetical protein